VALQLPVEVVAAEAVVAMAGQHFGDVPGNFDDGNIKGAAPQVVDQNVLGIFGDCTSNTRAAAVGSLRICSTSNPAISPASLVAWRWASVK
jgi:hypothetical protein